MKAVSALIPLMDGQSLIQMEALIQQQLRPSKDQMFQQNQDWTSQQSEDWPMSQQSQDWTSQESQYSTPQQNENWRF